MNGHQTPSHLHIIKYNNHIQRREAFKIKGLDRIYINERVNSNPHGYGVCADPGTFRYSL